MIIMYTTVLQNEVQNSYLLEFVVTIIFPDFPVFPDREIDQISRFPTGN